MCKIGDLARAQTASTSSWELCTELTGTVNKSLIAAAQSSGLTCPGCARLGSSRLLAKITALPSYQQQTLTTACAGAQHKSHRESSQLQPPVNPQVSQPPAHQQLSSQYLTRPACHASAAGVGIALSPIRRGNITHIVHDTAAAESRLASLRPETSRVEGASQLSAAEAAAQSSSQGRRARQGYRGYPFSLEHRARGRHQLASSPSQTPLASQASQEPVQQAAQHTEAGKAKQVSGANRQHGSFSPSTSQAARSLLQHTVLAETPHDGKPLLTQQQSPAGSNLAAPTALAQGRATFKPLQGMPQPAPEAAVLPTHSHSSRQAADTKQLAEAASLSAARGAWIQPTEAAEAPAATPSQQDAPASAASAAAEPAAVRSASAEPAPVQARRPAAARPGEASRQSVHQTGRAVQPAGLGQSSSSGRLPQPAGAASQQEPVGPRYTPATISLSVKPLGEPVLKFALDFTDTVHTCSWHLQSGWQ